MNKVTFSEIEIMWAVSHSPYFKNGISCSLKKYEKLFKAEQFRNLLKKYEMSDQADRLCALTTRKRLNRILRNINTGKTAIIVNRPVKKIGNYIVSRSLKNLGFDLRNIVLSAEGKI